MTRVRSLHPTSALSEKVVQLVSWHAALSCARWLAQLSNTSPPQTLKTLASPSRWQPSWISQSRTLAGPNAWQRLCRGLCRVQQRSPKRCTPSSRSCVLSQRSLWSWGRTCNGAPQSSLTLWGMANAQPPLTLRTPLTGLCR
jgi:hypothetical protein